MKPIATQTHTIECKASRSEIVRAAEDFDRWSEWLIVHGGWADGPPREVQIGTAVRQRISLRGVPAAATVRWTVTDIVGSETLAVRGDGLLGGDGELTMRVSDREADNGATVEIEARIYKTLVPKPLRTAMLRHIAKALTDSVQRLDALLEARRPPGGIVAP